MGITIGRRTRTRRASLWYPKDAGMVMPVVMTALMAAPTTGMTGATSTAVLAIKAASTITTGAGTATDRGTVNAYRRSMPPM